MHRRGIGELRDRRRDVYATLFAMGLSGGAVQAYLGPKRADLEFSAILDDDVIIHRWRGGRRCVKAQDVLQLVRALESLDAQIQRARAERRAGG